MHATSETQRLQRLAALGDPHAARVLGRLARRRGHAPEWGDAIVARAALYEAVLQGLDVVVSALRQYDPVRAVQGEAQRQLEAMWLELFQLRWRALGLGDALAASEGSPPATLLAEMSEAHEDMLATCRDEQTGTSHRAQREWLCTVADRLEALRASVEEAREGHGRLELVRLEAAVREHRSLSEGVSSLFAGQVLWAVRNLPTSCWQDAVVYRVGWAYEDYYARHHETAGEAMRALLEQSREVAVATWRRRTQLWMELSAVADETILGPWRAKAVSEVWAEVVAEMVPGLRSVAEYWSQDSLVPPELLEIGDPDAIGAEVVRRLVAGR